MWVVLAVALLCLQFNKKIAIGLLSLAVGWGAYNQTLGWPALLFVAALGGVAFAWQRLHSRPLVRYGLEALLVATALALMLHLIPGFHNLKLLDAVSVGPESAPFSMYYNFDKALIPFVLLICLPSLFVNNMVVSRGKYYWLLLAVSVPALLFAAVYLGGIKVEPHRPQWFFQFLLANIFFVALAEEALFRGYLQQKLAGVMPPLLALAISALLFGALHYAGGILLVIFAILAGVIYGLAWMWSGRLWVAVLFHVGLNVCHLLFFTYPALRLS